MDATVPGSMYMDLLRNKTISDPYKRFNDVNYAKYALYAWNYSRDFTGDCCYATIISYSGCTGNGIGIVVFKVISWLLI